MSQTPQMTEEEIKSTIDMIVDLADNNPQFKEALLSADIPTALDGKIRDIHELCIEKTALDHAKGFYKDFSIKQIKQQLVYDFVRMERFRRKNEFGDFCLAVYQQIECISNYLATDSRVMDISDKLWGYPAYINPIENCISDRLKSEYNIAKLVFLKDFEKKSKQSIASLLAIDKTRAILYFVGYKAMMKSSDYDFFLEFTTQINYIYNCRNTNHRGNKPNNYEKDILDRVFPSQYYYYYKFLGVLITFVELINSGYPYLDELKKHVEQMEKRTVKPNGLKILGKIPVEQLKKR